MQRFDLIHDGVGYSQATEEELVARGVPTAIIAAAVATERRNRVAAECSQRLYAVASAETQMNMAAEAALIAARPGTARSQEEKVTLAAFEAWRSWVAAMRDRVTEIAAGDAGGWPACPAEARAFAARL